MRRSWVSVVWSVLAGVFALLALGLILLQVREAYVTREAIEDARREAAAIAHGDLESEKSREDLVSKRFDNAVRGSLWHDLVVGFGPLVTVLVAVSGAIIAIQGYRDTRRKEGLDRAAADLKDTLTHLAGATTTERVVGVVGLQHFLVPDRQELHLPAITALVAAARSEKDPEVLHSLRIAIEQAMRIVPREIRAQVSWQSVQAKGADLSGLDLSGLDLRDAKLQDVRLGGATLRGARLENAELQGANLARAKMMQADLTYADLAGASLAQATLTGAVFNRAKVLNLDLDRADLTGLQVDWESVPWGQTRNWRSATFDAAPRERLDERYGPAPTGPSVLMLMWEIPPLIAGGTWTACYHFVRTLRRQGADLTVVVPWDEASILAAPFGGEVEIVPLGITPPRDAGSPYAAAPGAWSPYGYAPAAWSPYGYAPAAWSPYGYAPAAWSPYGYGPAVWSGYGVSPGAMWSSYGRVSGGYGGGPYGGYGPYGGDTRPSPAGSTLLRLIDAFRERLTRRVWPGRVDIIHAHDWVTFDAAAAAAEKLRVPWIAHVHSIEIDRRPEGPDPLIERIERRTLQLAARIVAPSEITRQRIRDRYGIAADRIEVVPNVLSRERIAPLEAGRFESKRVVFLGRLSQQKGVDRFAEIATKVKAEQGGTRFEIFGDGEYRMPYGSYAIDEMHGAIGWDRRGEAFENASVAVVPSRSEPFGMVILEAMAHRVPVVYPRAAGAAEVLKSGVPVDAADIPATAQAVLKLLSDPLQWETVVEDQIKEIALYPGRGYEKRLIELWAKLAPAKG